MVSISLIDTGGPAVWVDQGQYTLLTFECSVCCIFNVELHGPGRGRSWLIGLRNISPQQCFTTCLFELWNPHILG